MKRTIITLTLILALALGCAAVAEEVPGALPAEGADVVEEMPADAAPDAPDMPVAPAAPSTSPTDDLKAAMDAYRAAKQEKAVDDLEEELDGFVEEGSLTQEQADLILNSVKERIAAKNGECPNCGYKFDSKKSGRCGQQKQFPGGQRGNQTMPQDGQRPDAQSGATPRNNGMMGGRNQMPGNQRQFPNMQGGRNQMPGTQGGQRQNGNQMMPGMAPRM